MSRSPDAALMERCKARRAELARRMGPGVAVIATAPEAIRNRDSHHAYRFDSHFWYLTGFPEPEAVLVLVGGDAPRSLLFCREKNEEREIWDGYRYGAPAAREAFGFDEADSVGRFDERLVELIADQPVLFYAVGADETWDKRMLAALNAVRAKARAGVRAPAEIRDVRAAVDEMRLFKDDWELARMRRAATISGEAHRRAMRTAKPGRLEYEIEAELLHAFRAAGAQAPAYHPIVAGGANACVLHYVFNDGVLEDGDLLLIDAGGEVDGYAADITRTFPVNGRFSGPQREVYEIVLAAQAAAMAKIRPGARWLEPHDAAVRVLTRGMVDLGLLSGEVDGLIESEAYKRFYMHRTGHWLGLDVHDVGEYKVDGEWRTLQAGMTLTVEPGFYIRAAADIPERFRDIGIRIEDDVLVTGSGYEVLTADTPKTVSDIEAWMRHD